MGQGPASAPRDEGSFPELFRALFKGEVLSFPPCSSMTSTTISYISYIKFIIHMLWIIINM